MIKLAEDEKVTYVVRKHWFIFAREAFILLFLLFLPGLIALVGKILSIEYTFEISGGIVNLFVILSSIFFLFVWMMFFILWTDYYLDILVITNKHIFDVQQKSLFSRELSIFRLDKIQDITAEVNGVIQTFLSFGTITIQTAGEDKDFIVRGVPKPFELKDSISRQQDLFMKEFQTINISQELLEKLEKDKTFPETI